MKYDKYLTVRVYTKCVEMSIKMWWKYEVFKKFFTNILNLHYKIHDKQKIIKKMFKGAVKKCKFSASVG